MIAIPSKKVNAKISGYTPEIDDLTLKAKTNLENIKRKSLTLEESKYLDALIPYFDKKELIVTAQPDELKRINGILGKVPKRIKKKGTSTQKS
jgi:ribosomal protein S17E